MSDKRKEYWKKRYQENKPENAHRKATSAHGTLDSLVIRAEEAASFLSRRNNPPNYTLNRIMDLVEQAQKHVPTRVTPSGNVIKETKVRKTTPAHAKTQVQKDKTKYDRKKLDRSAKADIIDV